MISNSNIAISVDEIEALVSPETNLEPEPSKHPEDDYETDINQPPPFRYPPLDPVSGRERFHVTHSLLFRRKFNFLIQMIRK